MEQRKKHFKRCLKIGKLRFYVTWNFRLRNSQARDQERNHNGICDAKHIKWENTNGCCEMCGKKIDKFSHAQIHHILRWWKFPQYETNQRNLMLLCHDCHHTIHNEPFMECAMIESKCKEFGIDYKDFYKRL